MAGSIVVAAVAGAVGGLIGAGIARLLEKRLGRQPRWLLALPIGVAIFAASLARAMQPDPIDLVMADLDPTIQVIREHYPDSYRELEARLRAIPASGSADAYRAAVAGVVGDLIVKQRGKADAESSYALHAAMRAEGAALAKVDAPACAAFLDGRDASRALAQVMTPELEAQDTQATSRLLAQAATKPATPSAPMSIDDLTKLSWAALSTLADKDQDLVVAMLREERLPATAVEHRVMCDFNLALADHILARPVAEGGALVRAIWAMN